MTASDQQLARKRAVAEAAVELIRQDLGRGIIVGVGTGSTANCFIDALGPLRERFDGAVASSEATAARLREHRIRVLDLNEAGDLPVYVDGADESDPRLNLIKGGGGALTREKIVASASARFVCIADDSKLVDTLGAFPLPIEVVPMARELVTRLLQRLGGEPRLRDGTITDNGNEILDVTGLDLSDPQAMETELNQLPGVLCNGLFARRGADDLLLAGSGGVEHLGR